jgi:hypothetical protein
MQRRLLRMLVALALALAVPLQGFAAASAGLCMVLGHHQTEAPAHTHEDGATPEHHPAAEHCAPCVACCAAAAIASSAPLVLADERADHVSVAALASFTGIPPGTLDRPPLAL